VRAPAAGFAALLGACSGGVSVPATPAVPAAPEAAGAAESVTATGSSMAARWPAAEVALRALPPLGPPERGLRIVIDAGHGEAGNTGNTSVRCESEADFTRRVQDAVVTRLGAAPELEVRAGRPSAALRDYGERIAAFDAWPADAVVSLHSDARAGDGPRIDPTTGCTSAPGAAGFSVLYSDEGDPARVAPRERLAHAVAEEMVAAGFGPYTIGYADSLYERVGVGVYVDRHAPGKRIRMLRRPAVPVVIVETHQAWDAEEAERWTEGRTFDAFAAAIRRAVVRAAG
jgi:N-acetylmuramoyl-L-alanine amidase